MHEKSEFFLKYPEVFLEYMVQKLGYDTCYKIEGLNASKCATDCEELAQTDFAKDCKERGGLFKCCIR